MVIAFMCITALPVPLLIYKFGPRLRARDAEKFSSFEDAPANGQMGRSYETPKKKSYE